ncbi:hypothetical protein ACHAXR_010502 [Thalassiosira sp. AJA248-18]
MVREEENNGDHGSSSSNNGNNNADKEHRQLHQSRLAEFLCKSPSLLEYNVAKRLMPRLERVRNSTVALDVTEDNGRGEISSIVVDEESLLAIATLTDSRFETWLTLQNNETRSTIDDSGNNEKHNKAADGNMERFINHNNVSNLHDIERHAPNNNDPPSAYVIVSNLQSGSNIGNILRSASIFGCKECIVVGQRRYRLTGDHGSRFHLPRTHMYSHADVKEYLHAMGVTIYGIEIMENASPIMRYEKETGIVKFPFDNAESSTVGAAFIFGNEGQGLSSKQREICDEFLFIPQNRGTTTRDGGSGGSASMNVACAAAVILQAYSMWAGYSDASREGEKFVC